MNKYLKISLGFLGVCLFGIGFLVVSFWISMTPDSDKEEKVRSQAEQYLKDNFDHPTEIYDVLFDNMGNFEFDYAAKVRDKETNIQFLVYYDESKQQMVDTYAADKWRDDLESEMRPYFYDSFGESADFFAYFEDRIGEKLKIDPNNLGSYKDYEVSPTIRVSLPRHKSKEDEQLFNDFIFILKSEEILQHGALIVAYIAENGEILEDEEWSKEF